MFEAIHVYSPACLALTGSIVNCFVRLPVSLITMSYCVESTGSLLNIHVISNGESPFVIKHVKDAVSPAFKGSSPKVKDPI